MRFRIFLLILLAMGTLLPQTDGQPITTDNLNCSVPITYSKEPGTTLCDVYGGEKPVFTIGNLQEGHYENVQALIDQFSTNSFSNITIRLSGNFVVDAPLYFKNCNIICDGNATIEVVNTNSPSDGLYCDNTRFFSCTLMWDGIYISGSPTISFVNNCEVEDAGNALNLNNATSPTIKLIDARFDRNYLGIVAEKPLNQGLWSLNLTDMARVTFECTSDLRDENLAYLPDNTTISRAGIQLFRVFMTLGVNTQTSSAVFDGMSAGLRAQRSTVRLRGGCNFRDMLRTGPSNTIQSTSGWGIVAYDFSSVDAGLGYPCRFVNNRIGGIYTDQTNLTVRNSQFVNNLRGVYSINNTTAQKVWLLNNSVVMGSGSVSAFFVDRSNAPAIAFRVIVRGNVITRTAATTYPWDIDPSQPLPDLPAFRLRCRQAGVKDKVAVFLNSFTDNGGQSEGYEGGEFGFDFIPGSAQGTSYGNNIWFFDNFVKYNKGAQTDLFRKSGVRLFNLGNSSGIKVYDNHFESTVNAPIGLFGIKVYETQNVLYCSNSVENLSVGMLFDGDNSPSYLKTNYFGLCDYTSLWIMNGGLGKQERFGNMWDLEYENQPFLDAATVYPTQLYIYTPYFTESTDPAIMPSYTSPSTWFDYQPGYTFHECSNDSTIDSRLTELDFALLQGKLDTFYLEPELWSRQLRLLEKLNATPGILDTNGLANTFFQIQNLQPAGRFAEFNQMVASADHASNNEFNDLLASQAVIDSLASHIDAIDSTIMSGPISQSTLQYLQMTRNTWSAQIASDQGNVEAQSAVILQNRHTRYQTALNFNNSITTSTVYQANVKVMNGIILRTLMQGSMTSADSILTVAIAGQNPESGGSAVTTAHLWFPFGCDNLNEIEPRHLMPSEATKVTVPFTLFPVPAFDRLTVSFVGNKQDAMCSIVDATGKTVGTQIYSADSDICTFDVSGLPSGIYVMVVNPTVGTTTSKVFQILR